MHYPYPYCFGRTRKKYANRNRLIPMESMDRLEAEGNPEIAGLSEVLSDELGAVPTTL